MARRTKARLLENRSARSPEPRPKKVQSAARRPARRSTVGRAIPKALTSALNSLVNSPRGRELLASALVAAASAAAAALVNRPDSPQVAKARKAVADTTDQVASATKDISDAAVGALAQVVAGAMRSFLPATVRGGRASSGPSER